MQAWKSKALHFAEIEDLVNGTFAFKCMDGQELNEEHKRSDFY
jgi:hypothetical protein